jgi:hypothetical protein
VSFVSTILVTMFCPEMPGSLARMVPNVCPKQLHVIHLAKGGVIQSDLRIKKVR